MLLLATAEQEVVAACRLHFVQILLTIMIPGWESSTVGVQVTATKWGIKHRFCRNYLQDGLMPIESLQVTVCNGMAMRRMANKVLG